MESEDTATPLVREARHSVNRQSQAGLHSKRFWPRVQHNPSSARRNPGRSITCHSDRALHTSYTLRLPFPFPRTLQHLSNNHRGEVMWELPIMKLELPKQCSLWNLERPLVKAPSSDNFISMLMSDTLASVTTTLASRQQRNSKSSSNRLFQQSPVLFRSASRSRNFAGDPDHNHQAVWKSWYKDI
jgi:hypothetical protein